MTRRRADERDCPTPLFAEYYAQRARAGLIIGEATLVSPGARSYPGSPGIYSQAHVDAWRAVVDAVHARGGRMFLQLWHAGRFSDPSFLDEQLPVAPSALAIRGELTVDGRRKAFVVPRALTRAEIPGIVGSFADAANRARGAGFDGVEIHAAQGYLLDQFLRDGTNRRNDEYGGSIAGRARLMLEVVEEVARTIGASLVGVQLSPTSRLGDMSESDPVSTFGYTAERLSAFGLAYLHVFEPLDGGLRISPVLRAAFRGPMIANGGYDAPMAADVIARGEADLVSFGRPFIANPDLVERFAEQIALAAPDPSTFYGGGTHGYTDYPTRHGTAGSATKPTASNDA
jgi:N-ethylmaleimide reductase